MFEQYNLALADMEAGNYDLARERLEFIFLADPGFLDVTEKWVEVALVLGQTAAPTDVSLSTPSPTPTEDPRPKEELLVAAQALVAANDWTTAIDTLLALRKADPNFHTADVDGMLFLSLRNRGVQNILEFGLFEPGLYDFSLAENFGPLDGQALNYQEWARFYLYGNAFWYAYPQEAAYYYGQLVGLAPDLRDSSGLSAFYRYWQSLIHYADQLAGVEDWCAASEQYQQAQNARNDTVVQPTADFVLEQCVALTPSATFIPTGTSTGTFAPTWTASLTPTPDLTGSVSPTSDGSATFTPTASETVPSGDTETPTETPTFSETPSETATFTETPSETPTP
jgi:tetratricopeptide (TPR) repeat protein